MSNIKSKSSIYVQSLVDFALDTKPYHCKISEVLVEYRFNEEMTVSFAESTFSDVMMKAAWNYEYFSGGSSALRSFRAQRPVIPEFLANAFNSQGGTHVGAFLVGQDELTDLINVPAVYDRRAYDGFGINGVQLAKSPTTVYRLFQGHDWHEGKGSFELQTSIINSYVTGYFEQDFPSDYPGGFPATVSISVGATGGLYILGPAEEVTLTQVSVLAPGKVQVWGLGGQTGLVWQDTRLLNQVSEARVETRRLALDVSNPGSANRQLFALISSIQALLTSYGVLVNPVEEAARLTAITECGSLITILNAPNLPATFEVLLNNCAASGIPPTSLGFTNWIGEDGVPLLGDTYVDEALSALVPPLFFSQTDGDLNLRRSGTLTFANTSTPALSVFNISADASVIDRWTLRCVQVVPVERWLIEGDYYGTAGSFIAGQPFSRPFLSFSTAAGAAAVGDEVVLEPTLPIILDEAAQPEIWNIIRTNPLVASRPVFVSPRYGRIIDSLAQLGRITIIDGAIETGDIILTATSPTQFSLTNTADPLHTGTATVGLPYAGDGKVGFTILQGSAQPFVPGDSFIVHIENPPARVENFYLYYAYDTDPYDNPDLVYENQNSGDPLYGIKMDFAFDSRFDDYDINAVGLQVAQTAQDGTQYRFRALPNGPQVATLKQDGTVVSNAVDLAAGSAEYDYTQGLVTFPTGVPPLYSIPSGTNPAAADIYLYQSTRFAVEYYDAGTSSWVPVGGTAGVAGVSEIDVGVPYAYGDLSFTIQPASKPFISADALSVEGGDVFAFKVRNELAYQDPVPAIFVSANAPWIELHTSGMWRAPGADWRVTFTSPTEYTVSGTYTDGPLAGNPVAGYPVSASLSLAGAGAREGATFKSPELHFTIIPGAAGFAAGDYFQFETYSRKPSLLVHGSSSGWHEEAVIGEWYWNGSIGFKYELPTVAKWVTNPLGDPSELVGAGIDVNWVRPDLGDVTYKFEFNQAEFLASSTFSWLVSRSDRGVIGVCSPSYEDDDISVTLDPGIITTTCWVEIRAYEPFKFWKAPSTVINRSIIFSFQPQPGDYVVPAKAHIADVGISLNYSALLSGIPDLNPLMPFSVNQNIIDIDTGAGNPPLSLTSPETGVLDGWLPLVVKGWDSATSVAEQPDAALSVQVSSAATGEAVGRLYSIGSLNEPWRFEWDLGFFNKYVPLNTEANVVIYGNGTNEKLKVSMTDHAQFLVTGGVLAEDALFTETINLLIDDEYSDPNNPRIQVDLGRYLGEGNPANIFWNPDTVTVQADDTFDGFLPGYSNLPYDAEDALGLDLPSLMAAQGQYDTGRPLVDAFLRALYLFYLPSRTPAEEAELTAKTSEVGAYLQPGGIGATSLVQFMVAFEADPYAEGGIAPTLGVPRRGLGIDTQMEQGEASPESTQTEIIDFSFTRSSEDGYPFDLMGYGEGPLDEFEDERIFYSISISGPVEVPSPPPTFPTAYSLIESPLENRQELYDGISMTTTVIDYPARTFIIRLLTPGGLPLETGPTWTYGPLPTFQFIEPGQNTAVTINAVYLGNSMFTFSLATPKVGKVIIS